MDSNEAHSLLTDLITNQSWQRELPRVGDWPVVKDGGGEMTQDIRGERIASRVEGTKDRSCIF